MANEIKTSKGVIESITANGSKDKYGNEGYVIKFVGGFEGIKNYKYPPKLIKVGDNIDFEFQNYSGIGKSGEPYDLNRIVKIKQEEDAKAAAKPDGSGGSRRTYDPTAEYIKAAAEINKTAMNAAVATHKKENEVASEADILKTYATYRENLMKQFTLDFTAIKNIAGGAGAEQK